MSYKNNSTSKKASGTKKMNSTDSAREIPLINLATPQKDRPKLEIKQSPVTPGRISQVQTPVGNAVNVKPSGSASVKPVLRVRRDLMGAAAVDAVGSSSASERSPKNGVSLNASSSSSSSSSTQAPTSSAHTNAASSATTTTTTKKSKKRKKKNRNRRAPSPKRPRQTVRYSPQVYDQVRQQQPFDNSQYARCIRCGNWGYVLAHCRYCSQEFFAVMRDCTESIVQAMAFYNSLCEIAKYFFH